MGGGSWTAQSWSNYSTSNIKGKSVDRVYTQRNISDDFDPSVITMRESRDSDDHPNSTPIIIGLDVTGSMGRILDTVANKLGDLVTEILEREPVSDPQIMFNAIGDAYCDRAPLQVTQFESDIRIAEQLTTLYFERGGGGNGSESYPLAWYFASKKVETDQWDKRGKKGFIFTMGDDGYPSKLLASQLERFIGIDAGEDVDVKALLNEVNRKYEVFHLCLEQGGSFYEDDYRTWQDLLGERAIRVTDYTKIPEIIVSILEAMSGKDKQEIVQSWDGSTAIAVGNAIKGLSTVDDTTNELVEF